MRNKKSEVKLKIDTHISVLFRLELFRLRSTCGSTCLLRQLPLSTHHTQSHPDKSSMLCFHQDGTQVDTFSSHWNIGSGSNCVHGAEAYSGLRVSLPIMWLQKKKQEIHTGFTNFTLQALAINISDKLQF